MIKKCFSLLVCFYFQAERDQRFLLSPRTENRKGTEEEGAQTGKGKDELVELIVLSSLEVVL